MWHGNKFFMFLHDSLTACERINAGVIIKRSEERRKAQQQKVKPTRPRNEVLTKMGQTLKRRKAERQKLDAEMRIGQEGGISQQTLNGLVDNSVTVSLGLFTFFAICYVAIILITYMLLKTEVD